MMKRIETGAALLILAVFAALAYGAHTYFFEMDLLIAWRGFSVVDFANSVLYPENFERDYPGGAAFIGNSSVVWIYPFLASVFGVAPYTVLLGVIALEVLAIVVGVFVLTRTVLPSASVPTYVAICILFLGSSARQIDLANFASIFLVGQYYVFADMLRIGALCAFLSKRYALCAGLLMVGFTIHPTMTALTLPVLFAFLLVSGEELRRPKPWLAAFAVLVFGAIWFTQFISQTTLGAEQITGAEYFEHSRLFNYHWYLPDFGYGLANPDRLLLPFMALVLAGLEAVRRTHNISALWRRQIFAAVAMICVVCLFGLLASNNHWSEVLVKASVQRISSFVAILLVPFLMYRVFQDLRVGAYGYALLGGAFLASAVLQKFPYSIALGGLYALPALVTLLKTRHWRSFEVMVVLAAVPPMILLCLHWAAGFQLSGPRYLSSGPLFAIALSGVGIAALQGLWPVLRRPVPEVISGVALLGFVLFLASESFQRLSARYTHSDKNRSLFSDYKGVQLWARDTSDPRALFMVDPCLAYGWRDFSQRSSWGGLQEHLKTGWLYTSNLADFEEGLSRAKRLGIDSRAMLAEDPSSIRHNYGAVCNTARGIYYKQDPSWLTGMIADYGIDYFVYLKTYAEDGSAFAPVFENDSFFVLKSGDIPRL